MVLQAFQLREHRGAPVNRRSFAVLLHDLSAIEARPGEVACGDELLRLLKQEWEFRLSNLVLRVEGEVSQHAETAWKAVVGSAQVMDDSVKKEDLPKRETAIPVGLTT